jgi:hypothetical protein
MQHSVALKPVLSRRLPGLKVLKIVNRRIRSNDHALFGKGRDK